MMLLSWKPLPAWLFSENAFRAVGAKAMVSLSLSPTNLRLLGGGGYARTARGGHVASQAALLISDDDDVTHYENADNKPPSAEDGVNAQVAWLIARCAAQDKRMKEMAVEIAQMRSEALESSRGFPASFDVHVVSTWTQHLQTLAGRTKLRQEVASKFRESSVPAAVLIVDAKRFTGKMGTKQGHRWEVDQVIRVREEGHMWGLRKKRWVGFVAFICPKKASSKLETTNDVHPNSLAQSGM